ncbi:MAG: iron-sulfur cluster assembly scaffold protein [Mycoplasma sp.]
MSWFNDKDVMRQIILAHYDKPNNKIDETKFDISTYTMYHNKSSSCIDDIIIYTKVDQNNIIIDAVFSGIGCAISTASTDILCESIKNKNIEDAKLILNQYYQMIANQECDLDSLDELVAFREIYKQPGRVKCSLIGADAISEVLKEFKNE